MATYKANPVIVEAFKILGVGQTTNIGKVHLLLDDGTAAGKEFIADPEMLPRAKVQVGDYLVTPGEELTFITAGGAFETDYALFVLEPVVLPPPVITPTAEELRQADEMLGAAKEPVTEATPEKRDLGTVEVDPAALEQPTQINQ